MTFVSSYGSSHVNAFADYYKKTSTMKGDERRTLIYDQEAWKIIDLKKEKLPSQNTFTDTIIKILSINPTDIPKRELLYWIMRFNSEMTATLLKNKKIKAIESNAESVQFNSMNAYAWLSNFFITVIYDQRFNMIYPSVESGYVAFKARKALENNPDERVEVSEFAHCLCPKEVKQKGSGLWVRTTDEDNEEAVAEMERLVGLKFDQNPVIKSLLNKSNALLKEFTSDTFWGTGMGTVDDKNSNQLGKILERKREALQKL